MKKTEDTNLDLKSPKTIDETIELLPQVSKSKFVGTVDLDIVLNLKKDQFKESVRGTVDLPHPFGEEKKIVVFGNEAQAAEAKKAGAVDAGLEDLEKKVNEGKVEFDIVLATPEAMPKIVKLGKILGPKGLMPNPKNGTVVTDVAKAVESFKGSKMTFKMTPGQGVIRTKIAKVDMPKEQIKENIIALFKAINSEVKRLNVNPYKKIVVSPTMGPSIKLDISDIIANIK
jgi:large subunit ribosomal protein L1